MHSPVDEAVAEVALRSLSLRGKSSRRSARSPAAKRSRDGSYALRVPLITPARGEKDVEIVNVLRLPGEIRSAKKGSEADKTRGGREREREREGGREKREQGKIARRRASLAMEIEFPRRKFSGDSLCYSARASTQHRERAFARRRRRSGKGKRQARAIAKLTSKRGVSPFRGIQQIGKNSGGKNSGEIVSR